MAHLHEDGLDTLRGLLGPLTGVGRMPRPHRPKARRLRDSQRSRCYAAENAAHHEVGTWGADRFTVDAARRWMSEKQGTAWWRGQFGFTQVVVRPRKNTGGTGDWASIPAHASGYAIYVSEGVPLWVILHEAAHCVRPRVTEPWTRTISGTPQQAHGREFCATYLILVQHYLGAKAARALRAHFRKQGVRFTKPRAKPVLTAEQRAALVERLASARAAKMALATGK